MRIKSNSDLEPVRKSRRRRMSSNSKKGPNLTSNFLMDKGPRYNYFCNNELKSDSHFYTSSEIPRFEMSHMHESLWNNLKNYTNKTDNFTEDEIRGFFEVLTLWSLTNLPKSMTYFVHQLAIVYNIKTGGDFYADFPNVIEEIFVKDFMTSAI